MSSGLLRFGMVHSSLKNQSLNGPTLEAWITQMAQIKGVFLIVISMIKKSDENLGVNDATAYYNRLEKAHSDRHEISMPE